MKQMNQKPKKNQNFVEAINVILGITLIVFMFLLTLFPDSRAVLLILIVSGGLMNISNGVKMIKDTARKNMGWSFMMLGAIIIVLGIYVVYVLWS